MNVGQITEARGGRRGREYLIDGEWKKRCEVEEAYRAWKKLKKKEKQLRYRLKRNAAEQKAREVADCIICCTGAKIDTVLFPCAHAFCNQCMSMAVSKKCFYCRSPYEFTVNLIIP